MSKWTNNINKKKHIEIIQRFLFLCFFFVLIPGPARRLSAENYENFNGQKKGKIGLLFMQMSNFLFFDLFAFENYLLEKELANEEKTTNRLKFIGVPAAQKFLKSVSVDIFRTITLQLQDAAWNCYLALCWNIVLFRFFLFLNGSEKYFN